MDRVLTVQIRFLSTSLRYSHHLPHSITLSGENPAAAGNPWPLGGSLESPSGLLA